MISLDKQDYVVSNLSFFMQSVNIYKLKKKKWKEKKKSWVIQLVSCYIAYPVSKFPQTKREHKKNQQILKKGEKDIKSDCSE